MSESGKREQSERDKDSVRVRRDKKGERREKKSIDSKRGWEREREVRQGERVRRDKNYEKKY